MARPKSDDPTIQIACRVQRVLLERVDRYAEVMIDELPGRTFTRADAFRALLYKGLDVVESDLGLEPIEPKKRKKRATKKKTKGAR